MRLSTLPYGHEIRRPDEITVLIPAAGRVPEGLLALSNISCTALIPVGGRPVIWLIRKRVGALAVCRAVEERAFPHRYVLRRHVASSE